MGPSGVNNYGDYSESPNAKGRAATAGPQTEQGVQPRAETGTGEGDVRAPVDAQDTNTGTQAHEEVSEREPSQTQTSEGVVNPDHPGDDQPKGASLGKRIGGAFGQGAGSIGQVIHGINRGVERFNQGLDEGVGHAGQRYSAKNKNMVQGINQGIDNAAAKAFKKEE